MPAEECRPELNWLIGVGGEEVVMIGTEPDVHYALRNTLPKYIADLSNVLRSELLKRSQLLSAGDKAFDLKSGREDESQKK